jgi:hypothetical protein
MFQACTALVDYQEVVQSAGTCKASQRDGRVSRAFRECCHIKALSAPPSYRGRQNANDTAGLEALVGDVTGQPHSRRRLARVVLVVCRGRHHFGSLARDPATL